MVFLIFILLLVRHGLTMNHQGTIIFLIFFWQIHAGIIYISKIIHMTLAYMLVGNIASQKKITKGLVGFR